MKLKTKREGIRSNVDMTPMIDIVFQLILFFLVSTTFATLPGIKLNLPQSHTSESTSLMGITITADESGALFFNDKEVSMATLGEELLSFDTGTTKKEEFSSFIANGGKLSGRHVGATILKPQHFLQPRSQPTSNLHDDGQ